MNKIEVKIHIILFFTLGGLLFVAGCATGPSNSIVYQTNSTIGKQPSMSLLEAFEKINHSLKSVMYSTDFLQVSSGGVNFKKSGERVPPRFVEIQDLAIYGVNGGQYYYIEMNPHWFLKWTSLSDAQGFADAAMAMKYYLTKLLSDEETSFAEFQEKAKAWQRLGQKPALPTEAWKFRVLGDDAVGNKEFMKAADFYEQGLGLEPMWPAGQFNAAMIYGELRIYPLAAMHMKRYLTLKPDAPDSKVDQEKEYIWEEKAKEDNTASYDPNSLAPQE